jgi:outer membrane murein-binding lipoprotein Lpp
MTRIGSIRGFLTMALFLTLLLTGESAQGQVEPAILQAIKDAVRSELQTLPADVQQLKNDMQQLKAEVEQLKNPGNKTDAQGSTSAQNSSGLWKPQCWYLTAPTCIPRCSVALSCYTAVACPPACTTLRWGCCRHW